MGQPLEIVSTYCQDVALLPLKLLGQTVSLMTGNTIVTGKGTTPFDTLIRRALEKVKAQFTLIIKICVTHHL